MRASTKADPRPATWTPSGLSDHRATAEFCLAGTRYTEPDVVVPVGGRVVVAVGRAAVPVVVVPGTAAENPELGAMVADLMSHSLPSNTRRMIPLRSAWLAWARQACLDHCRFFGARRPSSTSRSITRNLRVARRTEPPRRDVRPLAMAKPRNGKTPSHACTPPFRGCNCRRKSASFDTICWRTRHNSSRSSPNTKKSSQ